MKKKAAKRVLRGLNNLKSNYYCEFSEKEHFIIDQAIRVVNKLSKPKKNNWKKTAWKFIESIISIISKMF